MGKNQTHSARPARSTKLPWGACDLKGHWQGVRKGLCPPPTVGPHEDPHLKVSTPAEESRRQVTPANREGAGSGTQELGGGEPHTHQRLVLGAYFYIVFIGIRACESGVPLKIY